MPDQLRLIAADILDAGLPDIYAGILVYLSNALEATNQASTAELTGATEWVLRDHGRP